MKQFKLSEKAKRKFRYGTNSIILLAVVIVVTVLANVLLEQIPMSVDLTVESLYTITDTTKNILKDLDKDVTIYALYDRVQGESSQNTFNIIKYLDIYEEYEHVNVEYVDLDKNPGFLRETVGEEAASAYSDGDYVVKCGEHIKHIPSSNMYETETSLDYSTFQYQSVTKGINAEACLSGAIVYVISDEIPVVYISTGNGEADMTSYSKVKLNITNNNFDIKELNLNQSDIPEDCAVIMFISPTSDLSTTALNRLKTWFNTTNGNVICLMDYLKSGTEFTNFNTLFSLFSLKLNNDVVKESSDYCITGKPQWFTASTLSPSDSPLEGTSKASGYFFDTRSIEILSTSNEYSDSAALVKTSAGAVATDIITGQESAGEKVLMASGRYQGGLDVSKILLAGSSLNLQDEYIQSTGSPTAGGILVKSLNWMASNSNEGDLIPTKEYSTETVSVTQSQYNMWSVIGYLVYPLIVVVIGLVIWIKRRHL